MVGFAVIAALLVLCVWPHAAAQDDLIEAAAPVSAPCAFHADSAYCEVDLPSVDHPVDRMAVEVMIGALGPFRFIVDTGADVTAVSPRLAETLGLEPEIEAVELVGVTGLADTTGFVTLPDIQAGAFARPSVRAAVIAQAVLARSDGLLGTDVLRDARVTFDFDRERIVIGPSGRDAVRDVRLYAQFSNDGVVRLHDTAAAIGQAPVLSARVGGVPVKAIVDTGSQSTLGNMALFDAIGGERTTAWFRREVEVIGATEHSRFAQVLWVPVMRIENILVWRAPVAFDDFPVFTHLGLADEPALIVGMDVWSTAARLTVDYGTGDVLVEAN